MKSIRNRLINDDVMNFKNFVVFNRIKIFSAVSNSIMPNVLCCQHKSVQFINIKLVNFVNFLCQNGTVSRKSQKESQEASNVFFKLYLHND